MADSVTSLFDFNNPAAQYNTAESARFIASTTITTISFGGYQIPEWEIVRNATLLQSGKSPAKNLLDAGWDLLKAAEGSDAFEFIDGGAAPGLQFGGSAGQYDIFSEVVTTVIGASYTLSFLYSNNAFGAPINDVGGLLVTFTVNDLAPSPGSLGLDPPPHSAPSVPEPSTWAMMGLGFAMLGYVGLRRRNREAGAPLLS